MPDSTTGSSEGTSSRWWEFYAVRYAMGTVVGAVVFYFLCLTTPVLKPLLFSTDTRAIASVPLKLDTVQLALLATYGLVYCYIASAPILVFHATRFLLNFDVGIRVWLRRSLCYLLLPLVGAVVVYWLAKKLTLSERLFLSCAGCLFLLTVWLQYCVVVLALLERKKLYLFYERLARRRKGEEGGITESYRHLREHGNSFFIVLLEVLLGVVLVGMGRTQVGSGSANERLLVYIYLLVFLVWIIPAVLVWIIATVFEREFSETKPSLWESGD